MSRTGQPRAPTPAMMRDPDVPNPFPRGEPSAMIGRSLGPAPDAERTLDQLEEQVRASERARRHAADTQAAILNVLPAHVALIDPDGAIVAVNESWQRFVRSNGERSDRYCVEA